MLPGLLGRVVNEGIGWFIRCRNLRLLSADARRAFLRLRVPYLVKFLAPRDVQPPLNRRQLSADQVFIDLGQFGVVGIHAVKDRRGDAVPLQFLGRLKPVPASDQPVAGDFAGRSTIGCNSPLISSMP